MPWNATDCEIPQSGFTLFQMPLDQTFYDPDLFWFLIGLIVLTLVVDSVQRVSLRYAAGDRCLTSFVNRLVAELMLFGMAAVTILTMYEATARALSSVVVDQLHWIDVYVSVSAILLILVGVWVWFFCVRSKEYYLTLMEPSVDITRRGLDLEVAGGYITKMLAGEFGLETTYSFGLYVREITAQGVVSESRRVEPPPAPAASHAAAHVAARPSEASSIRSDPRASSQVDLIDVNLLGWVGFMSPGVIGLLASYSLNTIAPHTGRDALLFAILVGWFWLLVTGVPRRPWHLCRLPARSPDSSLTCPLRSHLRRRSARPPAPPNSPAACRRDGGPERAPALLRHERRPHRAAAQG